MRTTATYKNSVLEIRQTGTEIRFRPCDLSFEDRIILLEAIGDVSVAEVIHTIGYLKTTPVEERQAAIEEALGVSFPCGINTPPPPCIECEMCGDLIRPGDTVHEVPSEGMRTICERCYLGWMEEEI